ncbi:MAG TPA: hypothetical protein VHK01_15180, partial [Lacipirellulaceae bacterium]|nr:hypothetical protein [Lacipirellulaceae bacterium]
MARKWLVCATLVALLGKALPAQAVDYFWQNSSGGSFLEPSNWQPFAPPGTQGPGGANDTVNFDLGVAPSSRYLLTDLSGQNDQLIIHNDSVELSVFPSYTLRSPGGVNPSLVVGAASGDTADVVFSGAEISMLETKVTRIGNVAGSTGTVTAEGLQWNG